MREWTEALPHIDIVRTVLQVKEDETCGRVCAILGCGWHGD